MLGRLSRADGSAAAGIGVFMLLNGAIFVLVYHSATVFLGPAPLARPALGQQRTLFLMEMLVDCDHLGAASLVPACLICVSVAQAQFGTRLWNVLWPLCAGEGDAPKDGAAILVPTVARPRGGRGAAL